MDVCVDVCGFFSVVMVGGLKKKHNNNNLFDKKINNLC